MENPTISLWSKLQNISFKWQFVIFLSAVTVVFLVIYAWCGSILKVDCHQVILR